MALTSGREEFAVAFVGKDEVSAMITELQAKLKGLEGQARAAGNAGAAAASSGGIKGLGEQLKAATSGATSLGGGLAGLRMGMLGIPAAVGGMVAGVVAFASAIKDAFVRDPVKEFHDEFKRDFAAMEAAAQKLIDRLRDAKGLLKDATTEELSAKGKLEGIIASADALLAPLEAQEKILARQTKAWLEQGDVLAGMDVIFRGMTNPLNQQRELQNEIKKIADERWKAEEKLKELLGAQNVALATQTALEAAAAQQRSKQAIMTKVQADTAAPLAVLNALGAKYGGKKPTGGGGGVSRESESARADRMAKEVMDAWRTEDIAAVERTIQIFAQKEARKEAEAQAAAMADATWAELDQIWATEEKAASRRKPIDDIAALSSALAELRDLVPEVGVPFEALAGSFAKVAEAGGTIGEAIGSSVGPTLKAFGAVAKTKREGYFLDGLGETAEAIKAFATPGMQWSGVGHAAAAAAFFYAAGKGGKSAGSARGGGSSAASRGGASAATTDEAPKTIVYNISAGVLDGQSVQRAIVRAESSARGTGWEARRGW